MREHAGQIGLWRRRGLGFRLRCRHGEQFTRLGDALGRATRRIRHYSRALKPQDVAQQAADVLEDLATATGATLIADVCG